jgi:hypothetical protein
LPADQRKQAIEDIEKQKKEREAKEQVKKLEKDVKTKNTQPIVGK